MAISIGWGTGEIVSSPGLGLGDVRTYSATTTANSSGLVVMITAAAVGAANGIDSLTMGGLSPTSSVTATFSGGERRAWIYCIEDISTRSNNTVTLDLVHGADWWNIAVYVLEGAQGAVEVIDTDFVNQSQPVSFSFNPAGELCYAFACASGGGGNIANAGGQTGIWNNAFFTLFDSCGAYKSFSSTNTIGFTSIHNMAAVGMAIVEAAAPPPPDPGYEDPFIPEDPTVPFC